MAGCCWQYVCFVPFDLFSCGPTAAVLESTPNNGRALMWHAAVLKDRLAPASTSPDLRYPPYTITTTYLDRGSRRCALFAAQLILPNSS